MKFANICVDISHEKVDRPFQYKVPPAMRDVIEPGMQVMIPFGKGNKMIKGFVLELTDVSEYPEELCKEVSGIIESGISAEGRSVALANWIRKNYGSTLIAALKTVLPVKDKVKQIELKDVLLACDRETYDRALAEANRKKHVAKVRLLEAFSEAESLSYEFVTDKLNVSGQTMKSLENQGIIKIDRRSTYRNPVKLRYEKTNPPVLSEKQQAIVDEFLKDYREGLRKTYLIHGITGSGKTEVYMEMIDSIIKQDKQVIVLIPEIALTFQTVMRFSKRFGDGVSFMHSKLSKGERYDQFERAKRGEIKIMIGPRSALFTPFPNLGLIVIDEEHESSYKSDSMPKLHARETAEYIAHSQNASLVLGSATPSVTAYYRAKNGEYEFFHLDERFGESKLPNVEIVDLRSELTAGNRSIFSRSLQMKMSDRLQKGEQMMLFLNRRGYVSMVTCRKCGYVAKCPHCDVTLSEHGKRKLVCHYCGYETNALTLCPECGSKYIAGFKAGTEKVEEEIKKMYPQARVLRMDKDTTKKKDDYEKILSSFADKEADILIGTQMIVKGHDFPNVTLVGILAADLSLGSGDYQAAERTFQLLTQAVGRAGRGAKAGEAVLQTYQPEHYAVVHAAKQDYEGFYEEEIAYRKLCGYPPERNMLAILITSENEIKAKAAGEILTGKLKEEFTKERVQVLGPTPASIGKLNDLYRMMIYVRHKDYDKLIEAKDLIESIINNDKQTYSRINVYFDFNPINGY